jgi:hypothetical protein
MTLAALVIAMMPPLVVFAVLQRSCIQDLTVGAMRDERWFWDTRCSKPSSQSQGRAAVWCHVRD